MKIALTLQKNNVSALISSAMYRLKKHERGLARGVVKVAEVLLYLSRQIVPVDTWKLHDTSRVNKWGRGFQKFAEVEYTQPYAIYQHEVQEYKHAPGRSWKYLEGPARANRQRFRGIIREEVRKG